ncbi:MAG TPA: UDP-N-acetylmuramate dehydrogenase [Thermodesulfovibrionales bacterium]|nr:UDP-N-acetylmuramate dehydrogenase [Thermodesulfovibrionales bacterium]
MTGSAAMTEHKNILREIMEADDFKGDVLFDEPMKNRTTLRIGGPADAFAIPDDPTSLKYLLAGAAARGFPIMPVGGGSNLLVRDGGIAGIVLSVGAMDRITIIEEKDEGIRLFVQAGSPLQKLVHFAKEQGCRGIEGLAGIPGSVGGAVKGNAGSFGYAAADVIESVTVINREGRLVVLKREELRFGYRSADIPDDGIVLSANVRLEKDDPSAVAERMKGFLREKREKQPLSAWSAGCVFRNPEGAAAGKLIDEARCKGMKRGGIEVSALHANFFINRGDGTAADFLALMEDVRERVKRVFGTELELEMRIAGRT